MTLSNLLELCEKQSGFVMIIIIILLSMIEVSKIKINPWTTLFSWIGNLINKPVLEKLEKQEDDIVKLKEQVDVLNDRMDKEKIDDIRREIFNFATSCKRKEEHTEKQFQRIIGLHEDYDNLIKAKKMTNGQMDVEYAYILRLYNRLLDENAFLVLTEDDD